MGARQGASSTSSTVYHPPLEKVDAVTRVWALSTPRTTDSAACAWHVSGAWSVARSPPPPPVPHSTPDGVVRGPANPTPPWLDPGNAPGESRSEGVSKMAAKRTPAAGTRPVAGNRPCEGWQAAYHAAEALDDGRGPPPSRINPCSGRGARM